MIDTLSLLPDDKGKTFDSRYRVVLVAAQRAKQIMQSGQQLQTSKYEKETSIALEEVVRGEVNYLVGQDARQAIRDAKRSMEGYSDQPILAGGDEDTKEIQQQLSVYIDDSSKGVELAKNGDASESGE